MVTPEDERIFSKDVNQNFISYIWLEGYMYFFAILIPTLIVRVPARLESNLFPWIKSLFKKTDFRHTMQPQEISILIRTSRASIHLNQDISRSFRDDLMDDQKAFDFEHENSNAEQLIYFMLLFTLLDYTFCTIQGDNFKYFCLILNFEDAEISFYYFLSTFLVMASNFVCAYIYMTYGFKFTFYFMTACQTLNFVLVLGSQQYNQLFLISIFVARFYGNINGLFNDIVCFNLFDPNKGIKYVKLFTLCYLLCALLAIVVNTYFIDPDNIYKTFYFFFLLNLANYAIGFNAFKKFKFPSDK